MEILLDAFNDTLRIIPFLFITYIFIESIEHKATTSVLDKIKSSARFGPLFGGFAGLLPQCGFSSVASTLYVTRVITLGTLISIYLATSDEMLPILISNQAPITFIAAVLFTKLIIGISVGFLIDYILRKKQRQTIEIDEFCSHEECHCDDDGIFLSAAKHTLRIAVYIFLITLILNLILEFVDLKVLLTVSPIFSITISAFVGLIPNCAASIVLTELFLQGLIPFGAMLAGLLTNAGVGLLVLFRINKNVKENLMIIAILVINALVFGNLFNLFF